MSLLGEVLKWAYVALFSFSAIVSILEIGKKENPTNPRTAAFVAVMDALLIVGIMHFWGRCQ